MGEAVGAGGLLGGLRGLEGFGSGVWGWEVWKGGMGFGVLEGLGGGVGDKWGCGCLGDWVRGFGRCGRGYGMGGICAGMGGEGSMGFGGLG